MPASEVSTVEKKKSFIKPLLIVLLVLVLAGILGYAFFSFKDKLPSFLNKKDDRTVVTSGSESVPSPFGGLVDENSDLIEREVFTYEDNDYSLSIPSIHLISSGVVYVKDINLESNIRAELFILKGKLSNDKPVEVVVAISPDNCQEECFNWWLSNVASPKDVPIDISHPPFEELALESVFKEGTKWKYFFYSDYEDSVPEWYLNVARKVYENSDPKNVSLDLSSGESADVLLMPRILYEEK